MVHESKSVEKLPCSFVLNIRWIGVNIIGWNIIPIVFSEWNIGIRRSLGSMSLIVME